MIHIVGAGFKPALFCGMHLPMSIIEVWRPLPQDDLRLTAQVDPRLLFSVLARQTEIQETTL
jgi:hypothetical protein